MKIIVEMFKSRDDMRKKENLQKLWSWALQHGYASCFEVYYIAKHLLVHQKANP